MGLEANDLAKLAKRLRVQTLRMIHRARTSHIGTCYSMIDLLAVLYGAILRVDPHNPNHAKRDRFILSKGHGAAALYATLAEFQFFPQEWLATFCQDGSRLAGHVCHYGVPGVELSTGSLGHGLSVGCGMALAAKSEGNPFRVFTLLSDGECDEGSIWEAVLFAAHHHLDNLVAVVDFNKIQSFGTVEDVLGLEPFADKWRAFGWSVREVDGHDHAALLSCFQALPWEPGRPSVLLAHTIKGKGVSFMENQLGWHYKSPNDAEMASALIQLESQA